MPMPEGELPTLEDRIESHGISKVLMVLFLMQNKKANAAQGYWLLMGHKPGNKAEVQRAHDWLRALWDEAVNQDGLKQRLEWLFGGGRDKCEG